jgi:hypothetical protein
VIPFVVSSGQARTRECSELELTTLNVISEADLGYK